jgi:hypothetical protein
MTPNSIISIIWQTPAFPGFGDQESWISKAQSIFKDSKIEKKVLNVCGKTTESYKTKIYLNV